ncbi:hypothetical protein NL676_011697 [Syzygium grande]|nr:hypothetical protein NL676_011697 [Syzygium grande]
MVTEERDGTKETPRARNSKRTNHQPTSPAAGGIERRRKRAFERRMEQHRGRRRRRRRKRDFAEGIESRVRRVKAKRIPFL